MSTNRVLVPISLVSQFLETEKIASRRWLQYQMELLFDHVFGQLSTKFEVYVASRGITGTGDDYLMDQNGIEYQNEPPFSVHPLPQFPATVDHLINSELPVAVGQSQNRGYQGDDQVLDDDGSQINPNGMDCEAFMFNQTAYNQTQNTPNVTARMDTYQLDVKEEFDDSFDKLITIEQPQNPSCVSHLKQSNQNGDEDQFGLDGDDDIDDDVSQVDSDEVEVKEEFDETNNEIIIADTQILPLEALTTNEQSNQNLTKRKCEGDGGDGDNVQVTQHIEEPYRSRKKPKLDTTQSNNRQSLVTGHSSRLVNRTQTEQVESNNKTLIGRQSTEEVEETNEVNKQIITLSLQCHQTGCSLMFDTKSELNLHMSAHHDTLLYQCLVKDCKQSYTNRHNLGEHISQVHPNTTEWHCDKCSKHFSTYHQLSCHNVSYHQLGVFKCAYPNCAFTGGHKHKVYDHYQYQHKPEFKCQQSNCGRRFKKKRDLKVHQRIHLGIKPYRCKWSGCGYAGTRRSDTLAHIKRMHLTQGQSSPEQPLVDPNQYIEVLNELM